MIAMKPLLFFLPLALACSSTALTPVDAALIDTAMPDFSTSCRPACGADAVCLHPCNDLIYCYPPLDGGCYYSVDAVGPCLPEGGLGCSFDFTPRCVVATETAPNCTQIGRDVICSCP